MTKGAEVAKEVGFSTTPEGKLREYGSGFGLAARLLCLLVILQPDCLLEGLDCSKDVNLCPISFKAVAVPLARFYSPEAVLRARFC